MLGIEKHLRLIIKEWNSQILRRTEEAVSKKTDFKSLKKTKFLS